MISKTGIGASEDIFHLTDQEYVPDEDVKDRITDYIIEDINSHYHLVHSS